MRVFPRCAGLRVVSLAVVTTLGVAAAIDIVRSQASSFVPVQFGPNIQLSASQANGQEREEPTIAGNPKNPLNLAAGFFGHATNSATNTCFAVYTKDGGGTWNPGGTTPLVSDMNLCFDPSITADLGGTFYYAYLEAVVDTSTGFIVSDDLRVARSTDGGASFPQSVVAFKGSLNNDPNGVSPDKPYIVADAQPRSKFKGTLYLSYTNFAACGYEIDVLVSRDRGRTWSARVPLSPCVSFDVPEDVQGSLPVVAPDGTAYVFYVHSNFSTIRSEIRFVKSKDGGLTWSRPADVAANLPSPGSRFLLNDGSPDFGTARGFGIIASSFPTATITPDGSIYVAWTDMPNGTCFPTGADEIACVNSDLRLSVSRDGGKTWSAPLRVNDDTTSNDQFFPWVASGADGLVSMIWQDRRLDSKNADYDIFYTNTADGRTFLPDQRISSATSKVNTPFDTGDYNNLAVTSAGIFAVWNDSRSTTVQVFTAKGVPTP